MKSIKTYGINGLLEWHGTVESNGVRIKLDFTNGSTSAWGVAPATFTTKNEVVQHVIENSEMFKGGRIRIVRSIPVPEESKPAEGPQPSATAHAQEMHVQKTVPEQEQSVPEQEQSANMTSVKVADKSEAIEWLKEHFPERNYTAYALRAKSAFESACAESGVTFEFPA